MEWVVVVLVDINAVLLLVFASGEENLGYRALKVVLRVIFGLMVLGLKKGAQLEIFVTVFIYYVAAYLLSGYCC